MSLWDEEPDEQPVQVVLVAEVLSLPDNLFSMEWWNENSENIKDRLDAYWRLPEANRHRPEDLKRDVDLLLLWSQWYHEQSSM